MPISKAKKSVSPKSVPAGAKELDALRDSIRQAIGLLDSLSRELGFWIDNESTDPVEWAKAEGLTQLSHEVSARLLDEFEVVSTLHKSGQR